QVPGGAAHTALQPARFLQGARRRLQWTDLRRLEGGMRSSSRYLATVRRARGSPSWPRSSAMRESDRGCAASSASIIFLILSLMVTELTASPMWEVIP